jgi:hypothetical protein
VAARIVKSADTCSVDIHILPCVQEDFHCA